MGDAGKPKQRIHFAVSWGAVGISVYQARFIGMYSAGVSSTEALFQLQYPDSFTVIRALTKMNINSVNGNVITAFRDDAADVTGTVLTVPAGSTVEVDSGPLNVVVAAGSKINFRYDATGSSSGSWLPSHVFVIAELN